MTMKRRVMKMFLAFGAVCMFGIGLNAQLYRLAANIPFSFKVEGQSFPQGDYVLGREMDRSVPDLWNQTTRHRSFLPTVSAMVGERGRAKLIFHRYGDSYFL